MCGSRVGMKCYCVAGKVTGACVPGCMILYVSVGGKYMYVYKHTHRCVGLCIGVCVCVCPKPRPCDNL